MARMTFDLFMVICVPVAVAIQEECCMHLQICNSCYYQVSEWCPMGLSFSYCCCYADI